MNKQKLIDMDDIKVVPRGKGVGEVVNSTEGQMYGDGRWLDFGGGDPVQYTDMYPGIVHWKHTSIILLTSVTPINVIKTKILF